MTASLYKLTCSCGEKEQTLWTKCYIQEVETFFKVKHVYHFKFGYDNVQLKKVDLWCSFLR